MGWAESALADHLEEGRRQDDEDRRIQDLTEHFAGTLYRDLAARKTITANRWNLDTGETEPTTVALASTFDLDLYGPVGDRIIENLAMLRTTREKGALRTLIVDDLLEVLDVAIQAGAAEEAREEAKKTQCVDDEPDDFDHVDFEARR